MNETVSRVVKELFDVDIDVVLTRPEPQFGDYSTNVALQLAGRLGRNPREMAAEIAEALKQTDSFSSVEVAGPGFINAWLSDDALRTLASAAPARLNDGVKYVIEYSCPNAFKELHPGHGVFSGQRLWVGGCAGQPAAFASSNLAATMKSFSVRPPAACVQSSTPTLPHDSVMSG